MRYAIVHKPIAVLVFILFIGMTTEIRAADWREIHAQQEGTKGERRIFVDIDGIVGRSEDGLRIVDVHEKRVSALGIESLFHRQFNCTDGTSRLTDSTVRIKEQNGTGVISRQKGGDSWTPVKPDSPEGKIQKKVCSRICLLFRFLWQK